MNGTVTGGGGKRIVGGAVVDYGQVDLSTAISVAMALVGVGFFSLIIYLSIANPPSGALLLFAIILALAGVELYKVMQKTGIEITHGAITFRRPILPAIAIPETDIVEVEARENRLPRFPWYIVALVGMILVSATASIYNSHSNPASMQFILGVAAMIFFPAMMYCTRVRTHYPKVMIITTADEKIATIYTDDSEQIARMLEATR